MIGEGGGVFLSCNFSVDPLHLIDGPREMKCDVGLLRILFYRCIGSLLSLQKGDSLFG